MEAGGIYLLIPISYLFRVAPEELTSRDSLLKLQMEHTPVARESPQAENAMPYSRKT